MSQTKKWVCITPVENIPLREGRSVRIGGYHVAIFNLGETFLAVENRCPHRGGPLADGIVAGATVVCPLHAWKVDLQTGEVISQGAPRPCVQSFRTCVEDGTILIELPVEPVREKPNDARCDAREEQESLLVPPRGAIGAPSGSLTAAPFGESV